MDYYEAISVSQLSMYITRIFNSEELLFNIAVIGEISSYKVKNDIAYFILKDEDAVLNCIMFRVSELSYVPQVGDKVTVRGTPKYYAKAGKLDFNVSHIELTGAGDIYKSFLQLKEKLEKEGLFDASKKKAVPNNAINIGVATSLEGAVIRDIENIAYRRNRGVNLYVCDCKVQGQDADLTIMQAVAQLDLMGLDVIIVARGGGSAEDLNCFNSERLARFVSECKTPIVSAVGHETDFTIMDFVSDLRAPTPSAGAELVVENMEQYSKIIIEYVNRAKVATQAIITGNTNYVLNQIYLCKKFMDTKFDMTKSYVKYKSEILKNKINALIEQMTIKIQNQINILKKVNPVNILENGYAQIFSGDKRIKCMQDIQINDIVKVEMIDGNFEAKVEKINKK